MVPVKWQHDSTLFTDNDIIVHYSIDNGMSWRLAWYVYCLDSTTSKYCYRWRIPHLKYQKNQVLMRILPRNMPNAYGISNGTFTILASQTDTYEPNDDFNKARVLRLVIPL